MTELFRKILVGLDGSELSWRALRRAVGIARVHGSEVWAVSVEELPRVPADIGEVKEEEARQDALFTRLHGEAREFAEERGVRLRSTIAKGSSGHAIEQLARESAVDLIVIGHRGSQPWHRLAGSTADYLIDHAPCAVLVERPRKEDEYDLARLLGELDDPA